MSPTAAHLAVRLALILAAGAFLAGCGDSSAVVSEGPGASASVPATTTELPPTTTTPAIDGDALLAQYGFVRCESLIPHPDLTDERRQEIYEATVDAGIGNGASLDPGYRVWLDLFVLDEATLSTLATIADPSEVCLSGQDPNDYVPEGPQPLEGPGWRWLGAAGTETSESFGLITTQAGYDAMWQAFAAADTPVEGSQPAVDFDREAILTLRTGGRGLNPGPCGVRFDGYATVDGVVVIDWFSPGGDVGCDGGYNFGTYAVALDLDVVGQPPLQLAVRTGPRAEPSTVGRVEVGDGVLGWPLAVLLHEASDLLDSPPPSSELADSIECRLFRRFTDIEISAGPGIPIELEAATRRYAAAIEALVIEAESDAGAATSPVIPRELQLGQLRWIVGEPTPELSCGPGDTTPPTSSAPQETTTTTVPAVPPTAPPSEGETTDGVSAGSAVTIRYQQRLAPDGAVYNIGVPPEWETGSFGENHTVVSLTGRGGLEVSTHSIGDDAWKTKVSREPEETVLEGPTRFTVPVFEESEGVWVATGAEVVVHQYFYESGPIRRRAVRWYELGEHVVVATLLYPDIPEGLGGERAEDILDDIHFFADTALG